MDAPGFLSRAGDGATIAYRRTEGRGAAASPAVVFLPGFRSDMEGGKALALEAWCRSEGRGFLRFDYTGHGLSSGRFEDGTIGQWADDAVFTTGGGEVWEGREGLRARFRQRPGAEGTGITHVTINILVKGTPEGAKGRGYWLVLDTTQSPPATLVHGHYFDTFVRTPDGWRIKTRGSMRGWSETRWETESRSTPW